MPLKIFGLVAPVVLGGLYMAGAFGGDYARDVERPPAAVMAALADLDIRRQPGNPGSDAARAGGVTPVFRTERTAGSISWTVMSGDQVATRMTAFLEPLDSGRGTRITAAVERGDAPDQRVSPAFQSEGLTLALFTSAIDDEIEEMTAPPRASFEACEALVEQIAAENIAGGSLDQPADLKQAVGGTVRNVQRIRAMEARMRRAGCTDASRRAGDPFPTMSSEMGSAAASGPGGASFEPGRPMVNVSRNGR